MAVPGTQLFVSNTAGPGRAVACRVGAPGRWDSAPSPVGRVPTSWLHRDTWSGPRRQPRPHPLGRAPRSRLWRASASLYRLRRPDEDSRVPHRSAGRLQHPPAPRPAPSAPASLTRTRVTSGRLSLRSDTRVRRHIGRARPRPRIRSVAARRVHRLRQQARRLAHPSPCGEVLPPLGMHPPIRASP